MEAHHGDITAHGGGVTSVTPVRRGSWKAHACSMSLLEAFTELMERGCKAQDVTMQAYRLACSGNIALTTLRCKPIGLHAAGI